MTCCQATIWRAGSLRFLSILFYGLENDDPEAQDDQCTGEKLGDGRAADFELIGAQSLDEDAAQTVEAEIGQKDLTLKESGVSCMAAL